MAVKIIRKWKDKTQNFQFGQDEEGRLYCRDLKNKANLICIDICYKKHKKYYYKFINPKTQTVKLVPRM